MVKCLIPINIGLVFLLGRFKATSKRLWKVLIHRRSRCRRFHLVTEPTSSRTVIIIQISPELTIVRLAVTERLIRRHLIIHRTLCARIPLIHRLVVDSWVIKQITIVLAVGRHCSIEYRFLLNRLIIHSIFSSRWVPSVRWCGGLTRNSGGCIHVSIFLRLVVSPSWTVPVLILKRWPLSSLMVIDRSVQVGSAILPVVLLETIIIQSISPNSSLSTLNPVPLVIIILLNPCMKSAGRWILEDTILRTNSPLIAITQRPVIHSAIVPVLLLLHSAALVLITHLAEIQVLLVHEVWLGGAGREGKRGGQEIGRGVSKNSIIKPIPK